MDYKKIRRDELNEKRAGTGRHRLIIALTAAAVVISAVVVAVNVEKMLRTRNQNKTETLPAAVESDSLPVVSATRDPSVTAIPKTASPAPSASAAPTEAPEEARRGKAEAIPDDVRKSMTGLSYKENDNISLDELSYLTIPYYDFNYERQTGHLVVNSELAEDVLDIFAELYDIRYPIEKMELVDKYGADDYTSIEANNTSAFNYRESSDGSGRISQHGLGRAIDINPQINPYVESDGTGAHENAREYWSRNTDEWQSDVARAAYIGTDTEIYRIFVDEHGWSWGGGWSSYRDYQHFEKRG